MNWTATRIGHVALVTCLSATAMLSATAGAQRPPEIQPGDIGKPQGPACGVGSAPKCIGESTYDFSNVGSHTEIIRWFEGISASDWSAPTTTPRKRKGLFGRKATLTVRSLRDLPSVNFQRLTGRTSMLVARLEIRPDGPNDYLYKLGKSHTKGQKGQFFVVVDQAVPAAPPTQFDGYAFARWRIFGITAAGELKEVDSGRLRGCQYVHSSMSHSKHATFTTCQRAKQLDAFAEKTNVAGVLNGRPIIPTILEKAREAGVSPRKASFLRTLFPGSTDAEIRLIVQVLVDLESAPAWMACGVGCCTVGDS